MLKKRRFKLPAFHILLKAWIAIAAVVLAHATAVSGGVAEPIYLWQLRRYQAVDEGTTMLVLLAVVIGLPALVLTFVTPPFPKAGSAFRCQA
jgi:hypothetical protein